MSAIDPPIQSAATLILLRRDQDVPKVLMGQRGARAAFMPNKYVFPGGRVDGNDARVPLAPGLAARERLNLAVAATTDLANALAAAAIRELWEETGLRLAKRVSTTPDLPMDWSAFAEGGFSPNAAPLRFIFRAVTPPGRPRRFDARFFLAPVEAVAGNPDDFSRADDELSHLRWVPLAEAEALDLPFITRIVLSELEALISAPDVARPIPFFDQAQAQSRFLMINDGQAA